MMNKIISEHYSEYQFKRALIGYSSENQCYYIDFYENNSYICSRWYYNKSVRYVEDAAENYVQNILNLKEWINVDRESNI